MGNCGIESNLQVSKHKNAILLKPLSRFPISCLAPKSRVRFKGMIEVPAVQHFYASKAVQIQL